jgi:hypothetical protein
MSSEATTPTDRVVWRKPVMFCVLPADLGRHLGELRRYYEGVEDIDFVVERRSGQDRRQALGDPPPGIERRAGDRRAPSFNVRAAAMELDLPRSLRRHAERVICTWRELPVHLHDADDEADHLWAAASSDAHAREELWLRYHARVLSAVKRVVPERQALEVTEHVFDELFARSGRDSGMFNREVYRATGRVLTGR